MTTKAYYQAQVRYWRRQLTKERQARRRAEHDVEDMDESCCTSFIRCPNCDRLHDVGLVCVFCGWDNSLPAHEQRKELGI